MVGRGGVSLCVCERGSECVIVCVCVCASTTLYDSGGGGGVDSAWWGYMQALHVTILVSMEES